IIKLTNQTEERLIMTNVMTQAWEIAYKGQNKFGGKVKEYFAQALKMAWALVKKSAVAFKGAVRQAENVALQGSVKQIAWAESIREKAINVLYKEVISEEWKAGQPKRPLNNMVPVLSGKVDVKDYLNERPASRHDTIINSLNAMHDRYNRLWEIVENTSAKFWINRRDNKAKNHMCKNIINHLNTAAVSLKQLKNNMMSKRIL